VLQRMKGGFPVQAYTRDDSTKLADGKLETIDNQIDQTTGTFKLKAVFNNEARTLWPNQFVNARMQLDTKKDAVLIPSAAIQTGSAGTFIYVVGAENKAQVRQVKVGITQGTICSIHRISDRNAVGAGRPLTGFPANFPIIDWAPWAFAARRTSSARRAAKWGIIHCIHPSVVGIE